MGLTPEERHKIYEEEKASIEGSRPSTGLPPNVAGFLCYLGFWVSGIVFLILEQKDRTVRFHAAQSIVAFGGLSILFAILRAVPVVGWAFGIIISIGAVVLWIFLMARAYQGEQFNLPVAGSLAEALAGALVTTPPQSTTATPSTTSTPPPAVPPVPERPPSAARGSRGAHTGRLVGSSFAIAWSIAALIFFNFYSRYIAYYYIEHRGAAEVWVRVPVLTSAYGEWLAVLNTALIVGIAAHILFIIYDRYVLREGGLIVLNVLGIAAAVSLLTVFPFDFSRVPDQAIADGINIGIKVTLGIVIFVMAISTLVNFIRLIVNVLRGTATYP